jgi:hypothetical protein
MPVLLRYARPVMAHIVHAVFNHIRMRRAARQHKDKHRDARGKEKSQAMPGFLS